MGVKISNVFLFAETERAQILERKLNGLVTDRWVGKFTQDHASAARDMVRSFYNIHGWLGATLRKALNKVRDHTVGKLVVVCDRTFDGNEEFFHELIAELDGIPSMFVLIVPARTQHVEEKAIQVGFDMILEYSELMTLETNASRHFGVVARNKTYLSSFGTGVGLTLIATYFVSMISGVGRDTPSFAWATVSEWVSQSDGEEPNVHAQTSLSGKIVVLSHSNSRRYLCDLILDAKESMNGVIVTASADGCAVRRLPKEMDISKGRHRYQFIVVPMANIDLSTANASVGVKYQDREVVIPISLPISR